MKQFTRIYEIIPVPPPKPPDEDLPPIRTGGGVPRV